MGGVLIHAMDSNIIQLTARIPVARVLGRLGYRKKNTQPGNQIRQLLEEELEIARSLMRLEGMQQSFPVSIDPPGKITVAETFTISSRKLLRFLGSSFRIYLIAVTIGPRLEQRATMLQETGELTRAVLVDAIGSETVENACARIHKKIRERESTRGFATTGRFSPGYGDWKLQDQQCFHRLLETAKIGISLSENYMMIPQKSVSAVIGVYTPGANEP